MERRTSSLSQADLSDYAMIGDCRAAAMISRFGSIDWLCLPDFASDAVFSRIIDEKGGFFAISVAGVTQATRQYRPDTAILETTLTSADGAIRITDAMPVLPDARHAARLAPLREVLRRIEVIDGAPQIEIVLDLRAGNGRRRARFRDRGKLGWAWNDADALFNLISDFPLADGGVLHGRQRAEKGQVYTLSLTYERAGPGVLLPLGAEGEARLAATQDWWRRWTGQIRYDGHRREAVIRSAITLRMMTATQSGALLAAVTTSLPEKPHGWMNWDYRYCWPRDASLTLSAFMDIGLRKEADAFFDWLMLAANTTRPRLKIMYDAFGRHRIYEKKLNSLSGYRGAQPVRIGNALTGQVQHDVYGEVMMAVETWVRQFGRPEAAALDLIRGFGEAVKETWREPDNGIWEIRDQRRHYTYSKVMAWYVFDSLIRLNASMGLDVPVEDYMRERDALRDAIEANGIDSSRGCYVGVFGETTLDASLLLLPRTGYVAYDDPKMTATFEAMRVDMEQNGLLLRYPPGFGGSQKGEGAFVICNFWAVDYLTGAKRFGEAGQRLERLLGFANDVGLYNEGVDVESGAPLGNMPQAFSHAGLINSIMMLEKGAGQHGGQHDDDSEGEAA
jgi:GH15 family glucan-1,4-alpha-glucosidase